MPAQGRSRKEILLNDAENVLGEKALETIEPGSIDIPDTDAHPDAPLREPPTCWTQKSTPSALQGGFASLEVGLNGECPRWEPGSVVRWAVWRAGFDSPEDAKFAAQHCYLATKAWNALNVGVTFEWVALAKDATFVLCHAEEQGNVLASAFFPNSKDLNYLYVFPKAFQEWKQSMWKVFTHELGHVLGLRHEFAMDPEHFEGGAEQLGPRNKLSVMNYSTKPPEIQQSDIDSTRVFYQLKKDRFGRPPKVGMTAVKDYIPM